MTTRLCIVFKEKIELGVGILKFTKFPSSQNILLRLWRNT